MDLVITGMSLSLQRIPSTSYYVESLMVNRDDPPVMVEHPGEVILQAIKNSSAQSYSSLLILHTEALPEYGFYTNRLNSLFGSVEHKKAPSTALIDILDLVKDQLEKDPDLLIVISETTGSGTAAIALSSHKFTEKGQARLVFPISDANLDSSFELAGFLGDLEEEGINHLETLITKRSSGRPVTLSQPDSYRHPSESILSLIHLTLAIKSKVLPSWTPPEDLVPGIETKSGLVCNGQPRPWLSTGQHFKRSAALVGQSLSTGNWHSVLIIDIPEPVEFQELRHIQGVDPYLFLLCGENQRELIAKLDQLESALEERNSLSELAQNAYAQYSTGNPKYTCCLLAITRESLKHEIQHAKNGIPTAFSSQKHWTSPSGSYFTPLSFNDQQIAFVYPGAFNSYPGMGQQLFFSFPGLQDAALEIIPDLSQSLAEDIIYTTSPGEPDPTTLSSNPGKLIESGISLSTIYTMILERVFGLKPAAAFGYSLGEISMLWANHIWQNAVESSKSWNESTIFTDQLAGEMVVVRDAWGNPDLPDDFWGSYILKAKPDEVRMACEQEDRVNLTIQNTPGEVVISGENEACLRIIDELECHALPMPLKTAIHHPAVNSSLDSFTSLVNNPVNPRDDIKFYSAATYTQLSLNQKEITHSMADMICSPFDFPKLVNQVYNDGSRIFIEAGPQKTCTRWIEKILKNKPHAVIPLNKKYQADLHGILKVISLLLSHGAELDLTALFQTPEEEVEKNQNGRANSVDSRGDSHQRIKRQPAMVHEFTENLDRISVDMAASHREFLTQQAVLTRNLARVLELQAEAVSTRTLNNNPTSILYSRDQIQAFTNGDHRLCFGDQFSEFGNRRFPRLPNGPLQLIDRVIEINGEAGETTPGSALISEVDLQESSWYQEDRSSQLPHVVLMEIALQPCGFLSAYSGSIAGREDQDLYFRNLDGEAELYFLPENINGTITNQVSLISSSVLDNVIIQEYNFSLFHDGDLFFQGNSSFGYFPLSMLQNQAGLDGKESASTWKNDYSQDGDWHHVEPNQRRVDIDHKAPHLPRVEQLWFAPEGGNHNQGYVYLEEDIPENAWFYQAHFYQDPVMPGSLGVETMARGLMAAAPFWDIPPDLTWRIKPGSRMAWKYRGQITPDIPKINLELHINKVSRGPEGWELCADGELWKNDIRIYHIEDLCLESKAID